jgi:HK97 family phage portal protein
MFRSMMRAGDSGDRSPWGSFWFQPVGMNVGGMSVTPDSAMRQTAVYACVRVLSESFAVLPFRLFRPKVGGGRTVVTDHWLVRLLCRQPNRWQSAFEWREMMQGHLALRGNAFNEIVDDGAGGIAELLPLHPDRVTLEMTSDYGFRYRYVTRSGTTRYLVPSQVWHIRGLSGDGFVGFNPIEIAREAIGEALQFQSYSSRFYANNATPPTWIKFPGKFAELAARKKFRESVQDAQTGDNRGKTMVLDQGMELQTVQINQKDMQFLEGRQAKVSEIARMFRVQPHKIGDLSKATFSNIEQQSIEFWTDTMQPWCERWESSIERNLLGVDTDLEVEFDMRSQMRGDSVARATYIHNGTLDGWLTRNEGRAMEGLDPIEGLDEPLVPVNERGLNDPDPTGEAGPGEALPDAAPADSGEADARMAKLLRGNAERMARRLAKGETVAAVVLADALAIDEAAALDWLARCTGLRLNESDYSALLMALGSMK